MFTQIVRSRVHYVLKVISVVTNSNYILLLLSGSFKADTAISAYSEISQDVGFIPIFINYILTSKAVRSEI